MIIFYAKQSLRTIAICYHDFPIWPPPGFRRNEDEDVCRSISPSPWLLEDLTRDLTLIGMVWMEYLLRECVRQVVVDCQKAGVAVKRFTGDNVLAARSISSQWGIFTEALLWQDQSFSS